MKRFKKDNYDQVKNRNEDEIQAARDLSLDLLNAISANAFYNPYKKF